MTPDEVTMRWALSWLSTPAEDQLRLMGDERVVFPEFELAEIAESARNAARHAIPDGRIRDALENVVSLSLEIDEAITKDHSLESREAVSASSFWADVRAKATGLLRELDLEYALPPADESG